MVRKVVKMGMCHLLGDYFFQSEYIADTKGKNWYHLFIHCVSSAGISANPNAL